VDLVSQHKDRNKWGEIAGGMDGRAVFPVIVFLTSLFGEKSLIDVGDASFEEVKEANK
jgi:hypothetical protein